MIRSQNSSLARKRGLTAPGRDRPHEIVGVSGLQRFGVSLTSDCFKYLGRADVRLDVLHAQGDLNGDGFSEANVEAPTDVAVYLLPGSRRTPE